MPLCRYRRPNTRFTHKTRRRITHHRSHCCHRNLAGSDKPDLDIRLQDPYTCRRVDKRHSSSPLELQMYNQRTVQLTAYVKNPPSGGEHQRKRYLAMLAFLNVTNEHRKPLTSATLIGSAIRKFISSLSLPYLVLTTSQRIILQVI